VHPTPNSGDPRPLIIDLMKFYVHQTTSNYIDNLLLQNLLQTVVKPTRISETVATVIDHIFYHQIQYLIAACYIVAIFGVT